MSYIGEIICRIYPKVSEQAGEDDKRIEVVAACLLKREQKAPKRKN